MVFLAGGAGGLGLAQLQPTTEIRAEEPGAGSGGWRATVAEYLTLYTRDTFANLPEDRSLRETELKTVGDKLALPLSVDKLALDDLALKRSQLYNLDRQPLAQIAYLAPDRGPVAFSITANDEGDHGPSFESGRARISSTGRKAAEPRRGSRQLRLRWRWRSRAP